MSLWIDGAVEVGDTLYDTAFSGHDHDEIDLFGPSLTLPTGQENPDQTTFEDEIPVYDPDTGEFLGYTNTDSLPVGDDDDGETPETAGQNSQLIFYGLVALGLAVLSSKL